MSETVANLASLLFLGFFLGMRHATDADHVIAIATIVSRQRTLRGSALIGAAWGLGHTITVFLVGSAIVLFGVVIPARVGLAMEFAVGIMLVLLGLMTLTGLGRVARGAAASHAGGGVERHAHSQGHDRISHDFLHDHTHAHGDYVHQHAHGHGAEEHGHRGDQTPLARIDGRLGASASITTCARWSWASSMVLPDRPRSPCLSWPRYVIPAGRWPTCCCSAPGPSSA